MSRALLGTFLLCWAASAEAAPVPHGIECHARPQSKKPPYTLTVVCAGDCKDLPNRPAKGTARYAVIHRLCKGRETWK